MGGHSLQQAEMQQAQGRAFRCRQTNAISRHNGKSAASLKRTLRLIVKKSQAQAIHKMLGRSESLLYASLVNKYTSLCMEELHEVWVEAKNHCQV